MRTLLILVTAVSLSFCQEFLSAPPPGMRTQGGVWPLPQEINYGKETRKIGSKNSRPIQISFDKDFESCDILQFARRTYLAKWLMPYDDSDNNRSNGLNLKVHIKVPCPGESDFPQEDMKEEYFLNIPLVGDAVLEAHEVWGALRGLETFSHLLFTSNDTYWIRTVQVRDFPRFSVRGILLDTSRHYLHPQTIKRQIDIMAQNKMNVFHWHIVDIESFPLVVQKFPKLHTAGAFTSKHIYDPGTVQDIIHYARLRGIRVIPEFDTPGHTGSWKGQAGLLAECTSQTGEKIDSNIIDPTKPENYLFLRDFFKEMAQVFPDKSVHLGGDEVNFFTEACWRQNPEIRKFMKHHGFPDNITALENYYFSKLQKLVKSTEIGKTQILWQEIFDNNIPEEGTIVHIWKGNTAAERAQTLQAVTKAGFKAILSSCWYLNYIAYGADWKEGSNPFYYCDPHDFEGTEEQKKLVLGGIVTMWGEFVDSTNVEARLWPRTSTVAERLWSDKNSTSDADRAWPRLHEHRCRMLARGFRVEPTNGPSFCPIEWALP